MDLDQAQYDVVKNSIKNSIDAPTGEEKSELEMLIEKNMTATDKKIYDDSSDSPSPAAYNLTNGMIVANNDNFTRIFLSMIDELYKRLTPQLQPRDIGAYFFLPIKDIFYRHAGHYTSFKPINRLYFLFLCNIFCNSFEYYHSYEWLPLLLSMFEQTGLTGIFYIERGLFGTLFLGCQTLPGIMDQLAGEGVALCNTTLNKLAAKNICKYGHSCARNNPEHRKQFHSMASHSIASHSMASHSMASHKVPTVSRHVATKSKHRTATKINGGKKHSKKRKEKRKTKKIRNNKTRKNYIKRK